MNIFDDRAKIKTVTSSDGEWPAPPNMKIYKVIAENGSATLKCQGRNGVGFDYAETDVYSTGTVKTLPFECMRYGDWDKITVSSGSVLCYLMSISDEVG